MEWTRERYEQWRQYWKKEHSNQQPPNYEEFMTLVDIFQITPQDVGLLIYEPLGEPKPTNITPEQLNQIEQLMKKRGIVFKEPWLKRIIGRQVEWLCELSYEEAERILQC